MRFVKMQGIGNDYVYVDAFSTAGEAALAERHDLPEIARAVSDRHKGVGSDGVILVCAPGDGVDAHVRMRMFNADGSESEMCGNGVRCVAKFAHDRLGMRFSPLRVETGRGVLSITYQAASSGGRLTSATVDMGEPILEPARVPVAEGMLGSTKGVPGAHEIERAVEVQSSRGGDERRRWIGSCVSMGNPHIVFFDEANEVLGGGEEGLAGLDLQRIGPRVETHAAFPRRVNAHFVSVQSPTEATMRTWERGAGATQACGTGACAVLVAGVLTGRLARKATLHLPGGDLVIEWDEKTNRVMMTGPAEDVFEGEWPLHRMPTVIEKVVWTHLPEIVTQRLVLRAVRFEDAERIAMLANTEEVARWTLLLPHPYHVRDAWSWVASHQRALEKGEEQNFAVTLREDAQGAKTGELIGVMGLRVQARHSRAELGYWIGVPFWGKGFASEAAAAMVRHGLDTLGLRRVYAYHFAGNEASGRVLAKAGMKPEGAQVGHITKNGVAMDDVLYGVTRE